MFSICQCKVCDLHDEAILTTEPQFEHIWKSTIRRCNIPNIKTLVTLISGENNFNCFHYKTY